MHLPWMQTVGLWQLSYGQWLAVLGLLPGSLVLGLLASQLTRRIIERRTRRRHGSWDTHLLVHIGGHLTFLWTLVVLRLALPMLSLPPATQAAISKTLHAGKIILGFLLMLRVTEIVRQVTTQSAWAARHPNSRSLMPFVSQAAKLMWFAIAMASMIALFGYSLRPLLAGLGVGGLALALAARQSGENLLSAFSLGVNPNFRQGDYVRVEGYTGHIEAIGLMTSQLRTLERTLVTIPNSKLVGSTLESLTARDRMRLHCQLGLVYGTTTAQLEQVVAELRRILAEHPQIWPDKANVHLVGFGDSSLNIEIMAWFTTGDWEEFLVIRHNVLLQFMRAVEEAGSSFAFPTRTLHLAQRPAATQALGGPAASAFPL